MAKRKVKTNKRRIPIKAIALYQKLRAIQAAGMDYVNEPIGRKREFNRGRYHLCDMLGSKNLGKAFLWNAMSRIYMPTTTHRIALSVTALAGQRGARSKARRDGFISMGIAVYSLTDSLLPSRNASANSFGTLRLWSCRLQNRCE
jgi:hypothetical protein